MIQHNLATVADDFAWFKADAMSQRIIWPEYPGFSPFEHEDANTNLALLEVDQVTDDANIQHSGASTATCQLHWLNQQFHTFLLVSHPP